MMVRRFLAFFLAFVLILTLVACAGSGNTTTANTTKASTAATTAATTTKADPYAKWPEREIRIIIPYKEGGASHKAALLIKNVIEKNKLLSQPIIVICMPNAATLEGQEEVLKAKPDGYTLLLHHNAMFNGYALGKQTFTYTDFDLINQIYETPLAIAVKADSPYKTLKDLVEGVKSKNEKSSWTWVGTGGNTHFASYVFYDAAGIDPKVKIVPAITKSDGDSITNLLGGQVEIAIAQLGMYTEFVKSGDVRVLGHSGAGAMNVGGVSVPSWSDAGYPSTYNLRCGIFAPKGTPKEILAKLDAAIKTVIENKEYVDAMNNDGFIPKYLNSVDAAAAFAVEAKSANDIGARIK